MALRVQNVLGIVLLGLCGCDTVPPRALDPATALAPLNEAEFDEFTSLLADDLVQYFREHQLTGPVVLARPRVVAGGRREYFLAFQFERPFTAGLTDRLGGAAYFRDPTDVDAPFGTDLVFNPPMSESSVRSLTFVLTERPDEREVLRRTFSYELPSHPTTAAQSASLP